MTTEIALIEPTAIVAAFGEPSRMDEILDRIEAETRSEVADVATKKGRDAIASLAFKVAKSKTALDAAGKKLNETARAHINAVDAERRRAWDRLEKLQAEIRKPLTDWEATEKARVDAIQARVERLRTAPGSLPVDAASEQIAALLARVDATVIDDTWAEFITDAAKFKDQAAITLRDMLARAKAQEEQAAELERLRADAEARAEADRIAAAEKAEADRMAQIEREKEAAAAKAVADALAAAEKAAQDAKEQSEAAARKAADDAAKREADLAAELAAEKRRTEAAAQAERDRIAAAEKAEADAREKRAADAAHRARIVGQIAEALEAYMSMGAMGVADAMVGGAIPHVKVNL